MVFVDDDDDGQRDLMDGLEWMMERDDGHDEGENGDEESHSRFRSSLVFPFSTWHCQQLIKMQIVRRYHHILRVLLRFWLTSLTTCLATNNVSLLEQQIHDKQIRPKQYFIIITLLAPP